MNTIESAQNPALKHLAKLLRSARARRESGQAVLEGVHLLSAYLQAGGQVLQVYVPASKMQQPETARLLSQLSPERVVQTAGAALQKITSLSDAEEITALIALPPTEPFDAEADCVVLERIQDPGNIGTILRSAAAAGGGRGGPPDLRLGGAGLRGCVPMTVTVTLCVAGRSRSRATSGPPWRGTGGVSGCRLEP